MRRAFLVVLLAIPFVLPAQEDLLELLDEGKEAPEVFGTFNGNVLVSLQTNETAGKGEILLNFIHRFGEVGGPRGGVDALWGLDFVQDVRLAFYYGVTDRLHVGVARNKLGRRFDFETKYKLLRQRNGGLPFSLALVGNAAIGTEDNDLVLAPPSNVETNVQRYPNFASRVSYTLHVPITRKFGDRFSATLVPMWLHRNYITSRLDEHDIFAVGFGTKLNLSGAFALTAEYIQNLSPYRLYKVDNIAYFAPMALGFEVTAGGHVFQLNISNGAILPQEYLVDSPYSWGQSEMRLGFNIIRSIGVGKRKKPLPGVPIVPSEGTE